jgi:DeoR/GlpR family transcriptional regulator of sugar metabolism
MLAVERRSRIEQMIQKNKSVLVLELAKQFDVTTETIRGDLEKLERQGVLIRTYGGATLVEDINDADLSTHERDTVNFEGKQKIGRKAAEMIKDGETIFLDASTSCLHLARNIKDKRSVTVITNAERVVAELCQYDNIKVICTGGRLINKNLSYEGRMVEDTIRKYYYANKFFFSCAGITLSRGLTERSEAEAEIKKAMMDCSDSSIFLCDHKKLGRLGVPVLGNLKDVDCMITDINLDEEWKSALAENDVRLISVE